MGQRYVLGLDWAGGKYGWAVCRLTPGAPDALELTTLPAEGEDCALVREAARIVVDAPVGLPDGCVSGCKLRDCDAAAKRWIGRALQSSVFPAPYAAELEEWRRRKAAGLTQKLGHFRGLLPAIHSAGVVRTLNADTLESHPELVFAALAGRPLPGFAAKTTLPGALYRLGLLAERCGLRVELRRLADFGRRKSDDFIDAAAMAVVASDWLRDGDVSVLRGRNGEPELLCASRGRRDFLMALPSRGTDPRGKPLLSADEIAATSKHWTSQE